MLFTTSSHERPGDEISLFFRPEGVSEGHRIVEVPVHDDGLLHRLIPLGNLYRDLDPGWTTAAIRHGGGSNTARRPIPRSLFIFSYHERGW